MKYTHPVTPANTDSASIQIIKAKIKSDLAPVFINVDSLPNAEIDDCFKIVDDHIAIHGGVRKLGWALWELPGLYIEAEFHAVWEKPDGELLDITPKREETKTILFLRDDLTPYENCQVNNIRVAIRKEEPLLKLFYACEGIFEILNKGDRKNHIGQIALSGEDAAQYAYLEQIKMEASLALLAISPRIEPYLPCPCGSGKKVKWCCGIKKFNP